MPLEFDGVNGIIKNSTSDGDVTIKGNDGGSEISALTFDMSAEGVATFNKDIKLGDNSKALFGAASDLEIYHDGSHSYISDQGTGDLRILAANSFVVKKADASENIITANADGAVGLSYDASQKLATTATGIEINGGFTATDGCTITTADNDPQLILTSTDADADEGPRMNFVRNSGSPANNDVLARISLQGKDAGANTTSYAELETTAVNVAEGSETGKFNIKVAVAGSVNQDVITMTGSEVVINDSSNDVDFRVEGNGNQHMLFVDANNDHVNIGTSTAYAGKLNIETDDNSFNLFLVSTDADANAGPNMKFYRNSGSPADNDIMGNIHFTGRNDNSQDVDYAHIETLATDVSDGAEDGYMNIYVAHAGTKARSRIEMDSTEMVINEGGVDLDFRVESDGNTHMLFVDGGNNRVGIKTTPDLGSGLHIRTADSGASVDSNADELVVEGSGSSGISILSGTGNEGAIKFGDSGDNNIGFISYDHAGNDMYIGVNAATRVKVHDDGVAAFNNGVALGVGTANTASNVLDDYEEGTWTAAIKDGSNNAVTMGDAAASYTKVGRLVFVSGYLRVNGLGSASGGVSITGLPFAIPNNNDAYASVSIGYAANLDTSAVSPLAGYTGKNTSVLVLQNWDAAHSTSNLQASELSADGEFIFSCSYYTT
jgi:hypothetical protein